MNTPTGYSPQNSTNQNSGSPGGENLFERNPVSLQELLLLKSNDELNQAIEDNVHFLREGKEGTPGIICDTDHLARSTPFELIIGTDGFIPLWAKNQLLRWRFNDYSLSFFQNPEAIKEYVRILFRDSLEAWGVTPGERFTPVKFREHRDNSDFEIVIEDAKDCNPKGCTLARAFFPNSGRNKLILFPSMFEESRQDQVNTMIHELGHIFGLRHFFAPEEESFLASELFGEQDPFTIMNYGNLSTLTEADKTDLKTLYSAAWDGSLTEVNGTPIRLMKTFSSLSPSFSN